MRRDADRRRTESYTKFAEAAAELPVKPRIALRDQLRSAEPGDAARARSEALRRAAEDRCSSAEREARRMADEVDALRAALGRAPKRRERPPTPSASPPRRPPSPKPPPPEKPTHWSETDSSRPRRRRRRAAGPRRTGRASCRGATTRRRATARPGGVRRTAKTTFSARCRTAARRGTASLTMLRRWRPSENRDEDEHGEQRRRRRVNTRGARGAGELGPSQASMSLRIPSSPSARLRRDEATCPRPCFMFDEPPGWW